MFKGESTCQSICWVCKNCYKTKTRGNPADYVCLLGIQFTRTMADLVECDGYDKIGSYGHDL